MKKGIQTWLIKWIARSNGNLIGGSKMNVNFVDGEIKEEWNT